MKNEGWEATRKIFINWLSNNQLKKEFSKNLCYEDLSLWWLTNLYAKDNSNETQWYEDLNKTFFKKNYSKKIKNFSYLFSLLQLTKRFLSSIFFNLFIKIFYSEKKPSRNSAENCVYTVFTNFIEHKNFYIDRQYGLYGLNNKKNIVYFIDLQGNFNLIKNYFINKKKLSKIPFKYYISAKNVKLFDILKIYFITFKKLFKIIFILKKKNFFILKGKDCSKILEEKIIKSFFGFIQQQLIKGTSLKNCLNKNKYKNFINCFDFHPESRCIYYFAKKSKITNTININHANYSDNNLFMNFEKNEFAKSNLDCKNFSPYPDIFFCQGKRYFKKLKKIFKNNKIFTIGSLKIELNKSDIHLKKKVNKLEKNKKVIVILCSLADHLSFIKILNNCDLKNFKIVVAPHPLKQEKIIRDFNMGFNKKFITIKSLNKTKLLQTCDYIIFGDTSLGLELAIMNKNIFRIHDSEFIPTFDIDYEIPTATNPKTVQNFLDQKNIKQNQKLIEQSYFYKYDKKASQRLVSILKKL